MHLADLQFRNGAARPPPYAPNDHSPRPPMQVMALELSANRAVAPAKEIAGAGRRCGQLQAAAASRNGNPG